MVGINRYSHLSQLQGAARDASAVADTLRERFTFASERVFLLLDEQATRRAIVDRLEILAQATEADDRILFFFAGHGFTRDTPLGGQVGYVAAVDGRPNDWGSLVCIEEITRYSQLIAAKHIFYVFDSCFSGLALNRTQPVAAPVSDMPRWIHACMTRRVRQVLTAGLTDEEVGDLTVTGHSIFTSSFLAALAGEADGSEGELTASRVMAFVADRVMKDPQSQQKPAYGDLAGSKPGGDFVFKFPRAIVLRVPAGREGGVNTGVAVRAGQQISISASGVTSFDGGVHFTNAAGMFCTYKGQLLAHPQGLVPMLWPHDGAYRTKGGHQGVIGSLIGWVGEYSEEEAFVVGEQVDITATADGYLYLAVNDAKGAYGDNEGEYEVTVRVAPT